MWHVEQFGFNDTAGIQDIAILPTEREPSCLAKQLLEEAFGCHDDPPLSHNVDVHIYRLRRKLEPEPANPSHFCTIKGEGYRFMR